LFFSAFAILNWAAERNLKDLMQLIQKMKKQQCALNFRRN